MIVDIHYTRSLIISNLHNAWTTRLRIRKLLVPIIVFTAVFLRVAVVPDAADYIWSMLIQRNRVKLSW